MPTLKELKAQFLDQTGLIANKKSAYSVCSNLGDRKMATKADWDFALANIIPDKTLKYQQEFTESLKDLITVLESQTEKLQELNAVYEKELQNSHDDEEVAKLKAENVELQASVEAFKQSNELYAEDFHNLMDEVEKLKAGNKEYQEVIASQFVEIEQLKASDKDGDRIIATLRNEIQFLNKELAKSMKQPIRVIQLEKQIQKLIYEIEYLQRENRILQSSQQEKASLNSTPAVEAFSDFCFALPQEWASVFINSFFSNSSDFKATYRKLSLKFHPDVNRNPKSAELFRTLNESYDVLKNAICSDQELIAF